MAVASAPYPTQDFTTGLDDLLRIICEELQISESRYREAEERYKSVNKYLEAERSPFYAFKPDIYPQGSMKLGTTVKPIDGPHDLDFVLELAASHEHVDPMKLLDSLYFYLHDSNIYGPMVSRKNRCVRIEYANEFYIDILIACQNLRAPSSCIKVPDRKVAGWKDSNPRGYAAWFESRSALYLSPSLRVMAKAEPIPDQQSVIEKTALQLAVQLLKRWRDIRYANACDLAPISIVLTTLAGEMYTGGRSVSAVLKTILDGIVLKIAEADNRLDRIRVHNPSNQAEDLSERWDSNPKSYMAFCDGIHELRRQWTTILSKQGDVRRELEVLFGETVKKAVTKQAERVQSDRTKERLGVSSAGLIGLVDGVTRKTPPNTFYGQE